MATTIAHQGHTAIHLVQVHVPQYSLIPGAIPVLDTTADQEQRDHETAYLAAVGQRLQHQDLRVTTAVIEGSVAPPERRPGIDMPTTRTVGW